MLKAALIALLFSELLLCLCLLRHLLTQLLLGSHLSEVLQRLHNDIVMVARSARLSEQITELDSQIAPILTSRAQIDLTRCWSSLSGR